MSVLTIIQTHCRLHALNVPGSVVSSTDAGTQQYLAILSQVIDELTTQSNFNVCNQEAVFTAQAQEDQGPMATLAPNGYQWALFETFYDRSLRRPLYGPLSETEWQQIKVLPNPGPFYKFRIKDDRLFINPAPAAPLSTLAFEYISSWAVRSSSGVLQASILADSDTVLFPENILLRGLAYRWKEIKGLPYQSDEQKFYDLMTNYIAKDKVKTRINLAHPKPSDIQPGVFVPSGNWMH